MKITELRKLVESEIKRVISKKTILEFQGTHPNDNIQKTLEDIIGKELIRVRSGETFPGDGGEVYTGLNHGIVIPFYLQTRFDQHIKA